MRAYTLNDINDMLFSLLGDKSLANKWWYTPNNGFDGECPADADLNDVIGYLEQHCYG